MKKCFYLNLVGDELLEWNGHSLVGKTYEEVHDVIADSRHEPQVSKLERFASKFFFEIFYKTGYA